MMLRQKELKDKFKIFNEMVDKYDMKECTFNPKINKKNNNNESVSSKSENSSKEKDSKDKVFKRLYNEEIINRNKRKENLIKKYQPSFHPKINENSNKLSRNWKSKLEIKSKTNKEYYNNYDINKVFNKNNKNKNKKRRYDSAEKVNKNKRNITYQENISNNNNKSQNNMNKSNSFENN